MCCYECNLCVLDLEFNWNENRTVLTNTGIIINNFRGILAMHCLLSGTKCMNLPSATVLGPKKRRNHNVPPRSSIEVNFSRTTDFCWSFTNDWLFHHWIARLVFDSDSNKSSILNVTLCLTVRCNRMNCGPFVEVQYDYHIHIELHVLSGRIKYMCS